MSMLPLACLAHDPSHPSSDGHLSASKRTLYPMKTNMRLN